MMVEVVQGYFVALTYLEEPDVLETVVLCCAHFSILLLERHLAMVEALTDLTVALAF